MGKSDSWKPGSGQPGGNPPPAGSAAAPSKPTPTVEDPSTGKTAGRVIHDERGNAVWDWLVDTARIAIDSTSRLLMRLDVPELQVEDTQEQELRTDSERDSGGGYDPYGGSTSTSGRTSGTREARDAGSARGVGNSGLRRGDTSNSAGGGYDPYGKGVTKKPTRKP